MAMRRLLVGFAAWAALGVLLAVPALGDSLNLSVSPAQPTDATGVTVTASGTTQDPSGVALNLHYRVAGTGGCSAEPGSDTGSGIAPDGATSGTGSFTFTAPAPVSVPIGSYTLCGWVTDVSDASIFGPVSTTFSVIAADTLALQPPAGATAGQPFDVGASGNVYDGSAVISVTYKPAGAGCAGTPAADSGTVTESGVPPSTNGSSAYTATAASQLELDAGSYLFCGWLVDANTSAVLTQTTRTITVQGFSPSLALRTATRVDPGQAFSVNVSAQLPANVPTTAVAELVPKRSGTACAGNPDAEPTSATQLLDDQLTDSQVPSGPVSTSEQNEAQLATPGSYLVCAWLLNGWSNAAHPPTIGGPVSATVSVVPNRVFHGRTSQHRAMSITLAAAERLVLDITYADHIRCPRRALFPTGGAWNGNWTGEFGADTLGTVHVGRQGGVNIRLTGNANHTFTLTGRLAGRKLTGRFTEAGRAFAFTSNNAQSFRCSARGVRFSLSG
jgi:hypothetical protein